MQYNQNSVLLKVTGLQYFHVLGFLIITSWLHGMSYDVSPLISQFRINCKIDINLFSNILLEI